jgi:hypothetical protein
VRLLPQDGRRTERLLPGLPPPLRSLGVTFTDELSDPLSPQVGVQILPAGQGSEENRVLGRILQAPEVFAALVPATLVPKDQLWFHHPEMQARIRRAESDLAEGRSTQTQTPEEALSFLAGLKKASTAKRQAADGAQADVPHGRLVRAVEGEAISI